MIQRSGRSAAGPFTQRRVMYNLNGKVALVTGAGSERGMGRAIANRLAQAGADVIVNDIAQNPYAEYSAGWGGVDEVASEIQGLGRLSLAVLADISDSAQVDEMVRKGLERFGHIDILANAVALRQGPDLVPVVDLPEEVWDRTQRVNVKATFLCCKAVAPGMIRRGEGGKIIIISSLSGKRGLADHAAYCTSKFALIGFTQSLALELAQHSINVNAICPGSVETDRTTSIAAATTPEGLTLEEYRPNYVQRAADRVPLGRVGKPSDVANLAAFLASSESDYLTGLSINVAGGSFMG